MAVVTIYTDGACKGNPGPGGWGAVIERPGLPQQCIFGGEALTTNNRMELLAAIEALAALEIPTTVSLYTDSVYLRQGITQWISNWKRNGWRTSQKNQVKNADLWRDLDTQNQRHQITWHWIKGHAGDPGNELADKLANKGVLQAHE